MKNKCLKKLPSGPLFWPKSVGTSSVIKAYNKASLGKELRVKPVWQSLQQGEGGMKKQVRSKLFCCPYAGPLLQ
jgi:hypothetical protein